MAESLAETAHTAIDRDRLAAITTLAAGRRAGPEGPPCALEAVAAIAGEPASDHPACLCPVLGRLVRTWNDALPQDARDGLILPLLPRLVGTRGSAALEEARAALAADWLVRVHAPAWMRLAGLEVEADRMSDLPALADVAQAASLCDLLRASRRRAAVSDTAWAAAGALARAAAWDGTQRAAWAAVEGPWNAGGRAVQAAGWDLAYTAAYAAARACGKAPLEPTRLALRRSALGLVERMIAVPDPSPPAGDADDPLAA